MRSLTLPESALRPKPLPSYLKQPLKTPPHSSACFFPLNSVYKKRSFKAFFDNPSPVFSRCLRQWCGNQFEEAFGHFLPTVPENWDGLEVRDLDYKNYQIAPESMSFQEYTCVSDKLPAKNNKIKEYCIVDSFASYGGLVKLLLLFGYFTLQDSQMAIAAMEFSNGLRSIPYSGDLGDISTGFASAFLLIFFSELGDKTFFIAALLAARNSAATVFTGTFGALGLMTIISVVIGRTFHYVDEILPFRVGEADLPVDDIAAVCLLVYFGVSTLIDATSSDGLKAEDEQKEAELAVSELSGNGAGMLAAANTIISTFVLVFVAEWGDKSFFSTIALAAASSPLGVIGGSLAGHGVATLIAVLGGSLLGTFLSEKVIAYIGGSLFLVFAAVTLIEIVT